MQLRQIMTRNVETVEPDTTLQEAGVRFRPANGRDTVGGSWNLLFWTNHESECIDRPD
jgi:CBS domain-containing protein